MNATLEGKSQKSLIFGQPFPVTAEILDEIGRQLREVVGASGPTIFHSRMASHHKEGDDVVESSKEEGEGFSYIDYSIAS